jgi:long-chain fatty acid transport protein
MSDKFTAMFAFAIDETPVPKEHLGFELPDSDAKIFSMGFRYQQSKNLSWGMALLVDSKESQTLTKGVADNQILTNGGSFSGGGAVLSTIGISYRY